MGISYGMDKRIIQRVAWSFLAAGLLAGLPVVQRFFLLPVYISIDQQYVLSLVNRVCALLLLPGKAMVYVVSPPTEHYFELPGLLAASFINFVIYGAALFGLGTMIARRRDRGQQRLGGRQSPLDNGQPVSPERRAFLRQATGTGAGLILVGSGSYPVLVRPGWLTVRQIRVPIDNLPAAFAGFRIVQLTDLHHDEWISIEHVRDAVELANSLKPDLVALTGDYITSRGELIGQTAAELSRLRSRAGSVGVLGNHDWWADVAETRRAFAEAGISMIDNSRVFISAEGRLGSALEEGGICIAGVGDLWEDSVEPEQALEHVPQDMVRILLSHNPDVAEDKVIATGAVKVDLMLSGHTHGGQVRLPFLGTPVVPSDYGQKYAHGLVEGPGCRINISSGVGMGLLPVRIGVPPEVCVIELVQNGSPAV